MTEQIEIIKSIMQAIGISYIRMVQDEVHGSINGKEWFNLSDNDLSWALNDD
jgi:hypothetical protein